MCGKNSGKLTMNIFRLSYASLNPEEEPEECRKMVLLKMFWRPFAEAQGAPYNWRCEKHGSLTSWAGPA